MEMVISHSYDVYQWQVPKELPKNAVCNFKNILCSNGCFYEQCSIYFIETHIYLSFNVPNFIEK